MYSALYFAEAGTLVLGAILSPLLLRRFGKRNLALAGAIVAVVAHAAFMLNTQSFTWALVTSIIRALGEAPLTALVFGMMGDVIEFGQWKTHIRQEALVFAGGSLGFKFGMGITSAILASLLGGAGYISSSDGFAEQPQSALNMIEGIYVWGPILVWVVAVIVLALYRLDKIYPQIMSDLSDREAKGSL
jgi:GPH family glycoside/pentoside/hexuronide:cation symporter